MLSATQRRLLWLSSLGGVLEFYDFIIYALLASYLSKVFFPASNSLTSLMITFEAFAVGYLVRPIGGLLFGHFGDRFGRKKTFTLSVFMMGLATLAIGLLPSYAQLGWIAALLLTLLRVVQGLSVGGEIPGMIAYISESMPERKGYACGLIFFALLNGIVIGSLFTAVLTYYLSEAAMLAWGWRVPFVLGGVFGCLSYWLRRHLQESDLFISIVDEVERVPLLAVFRYHWRNALAAVLIVGFGAAIVVLLFLFIPAYLHRILHIKAQAYVWWKTAALFLGASLCIVFGFFADSHCERRVLMWVCLLAMLLAYPIFMIYAYHFPLFYWALLMSAVLLLGLGQYTQFASLIISNRNALQSSVSRCSGCASAVVTPQRRSL